MMDDLVEVLSATLFDLDPANTCCKENECLTEYDYVAFDIALQVEDGIDIEGAIQDSFLDLFGIELSDNVVQTIIRMLG